MVLPLESGRQWLPPEPGTVGQVLVTFRGEHIGQAPVRWGGSPWDRDRFLDAVLTRFNDSIVGRLGPDAKRSRDAVQKFEIFA
jgi:hypothetical protein